jgi:hypothetical protein
MAPINHYHYVTKQISVVTPLWGAITPEQHFSIGNGVMGMYVDGIICSVISSMSSAGNGTCNSLRTMADTLNICNIAYIEDGALHLISEHGLLEFVNLNPHCDFVGMLGLQLCEE